MSHVVLPDWKSSQVKAPEMTKSNFTCNIWLALRFILQRNGNSRLVLYFHNDNISAVQQSFSSTQKKILGYQIEYSLWQQL